MGGDAVIPEVHRNEQRRYDTRVSVGLDLYVALQFTLGIPVVMWVLLSYSTLDVTLLGMLALAYFMGLDSLVLWLTLVYLKTTYGFLSCFLI